MSNALKRGLNGSVVPGCSTGITLVFCWYSEMFRVVFCCSTTVPGCSAAPLVFHVPLFRVPAFSWFYSMPFTCCCCLYRQFNLYKKLYCIFTSVQKLTKILNVKNVNVKMLL